MLTQGKRNREPEEAHIQPPEENPYVNIRWRMFPDELVQKLNPRWPAGDDSSCSGCGCGCG
jgi:hypothetical protein